MSYKNSKNRYPQKGLTSVECILDMSPKISKMENVYLLTITEFTHLFVGIKPMRPVMEIPVVDLTFQFEEEIEMSEYAKMLELFDRQRNHTDPAQISVKTDDKYWFTIEGHSLLVSPRMVLRHFELDTLFLVIIEIPIYIGYLGKFKRKVPLP